MTLKWATDRREAARLPPYNVEGIVIRVRDFNEADKIITVLTRDHGKVVAVARGARRPRSRFAAATQLFTQCQIALFKGGKLDSVSQVQIVESFRPLRADLRRLAYATYACELAGEMIPEEQPIAMAYLLLLTALHLMCDAANDPGLVCAAFELRLLNLSGFCPELSRCVRCGAALGKGAVRFSPSLGGALCGHCPGEGARVSFLSETGLQTMRQLLDGDLRTVCQLEVTLQTGLEIADVLEQYTGVRLDKRLRSLEFLKGLR